VRLPGLLAGPITARRRSLALAGAGALVLAALAGGELGGVALRAAALLGALALAAAWLRRRQGPQPASLGSVEARQPLSREAGLALVRVEARRLLVGYGSNGVTLVAELAPREATDECGFTASNRLVGKEPAP
jgi:flagellar protein FliO/FliZ